MNGLDEKGVEAATNELLAHGEFSSILGNNELNARIAAAETIRAYLAAATPKAGTVEVTSEMVSGYKSAYAAYLDEVARGLFDPPSPDISYHATQHALEYVFENLVPSPSVVEVAEPVAQIKEVCNVLGCTTAPGVALRFAKELRRDLSRAHERHVELLQSWDEASPTERQELDRLRRGWGPSTPTERMARRTDLREAMTAIERAMDAVLPDEKEDEELTRDHFQAAHDQLTKGHRTIIALLHALPELSAPEHPAPPSLVPDGLEALVERTERKLRHCVAKPMRNIETFPHACSLGLDAIDALKAQAIALKAERYEALADHKWMTANRNKWQDATTIARNRAETAERDTAAAEEVIRPFAERSAEAVRPDDDDNSGLTVKAKHLRAAARWLAVRAK